jgi:hypothetical protein
MKYFAGLICVCCPPRSLRRPSRLVTSSMTPVVERDVIYFGSTDGNLYAIS